MTSTGTNIILKYISLIANGRRRRAVAPVTCKDIQLNPEKACQIFHFHCPMCLNETVVLKQGNDSIDAIHAVPELCLYDLYV